MSATAPYMSVSLDGFIARPNEDLSSGSATAGTRPLDWVFNASRLDTKGIPVF
jgi:hypothetical protein